MSIARMLHADLVVGAGAGATLVDRLVGAGCFHVVDLHRGLDEDLAAIERPAAVDAAAVEGSLANVRQVLETFDRFLPVKKGMLQGFFGSPPYVREGELKGRASGLDLPRYAPELARRVEEHDRVAADLASARTLAAELAPWEAMDADLASLAAAGRACILPVRATIVQHDALAGLVDGSGFADDVCWQEVSRDERTVHGTWIALAERRAALEDLVRRAGAGVVKLPGLPGTPEKTSRGSLPTRPAWRRAATSWPRRWPRKPR